MAQLSQPIFQNGFIHSTPKHLSFSIANGNFSNCSFHISTIVCLNRAIGEMSTGLPGTSAASCSGLPVVTLSSNVLKASRETKSTSTHFCTFAVPTLECLPKQACPATALQDLSDLSGQLQFLASLLSQHQHGSWKPIRQEKRIQFPTGD